MGVLDILGMKHGGTPVRALISLKRLQARLFVMRVLFT
jgi:hypothetical protein